VGSFFDEWRKSTIDHIEVVAGGVGNSSDRISGRESDLAQALHHNALKAAVDFPANAAPSAIILAHAMPEKAELCKPMSCTIGCIGMTSRPQWQGTKPQ